MPPYWIVVKDHPLDQILCDIRKGVSTRSQFNNFCKYYTFISQIEPKIIFDAILEKGWLFFVQEELIQFKQNGIWDLVTHPYDKPSLALDGCLGINWIKMA